MLTVDFFDAFYLATFMPRLSWVALATILVIHYLQTPVELHNLHQRTHYILPRLHEVAGIANSDPKRDLLTALRSLCDSSEPFSEQIRMETRVYSSIFHRLSPEGRQVLRKFGPPSAATIEHSTNLNQVFPGLAKSEAIPRRDSVTEETKSGSQRVPIGHPISVAPRVNVPTASSHQKRAQSGHSLKETIFQEALELLFTSECLVLIEYVEVVIPSLYGFYVLIMVHLPNTQYHTEMVGITHENVSEIVVRMFIYALVETLSFVILAVITRRNCGIQAMYQLGFVLETQKAFILPKLMLWIMFTLTFRIVHFGADFSFQFEWIKNKAY